LGRGEIKRGDGEFLFPPFPPPSLWEGGGLRRGMGK